MSKGAHVATSIKNLNLSLAKTNAPSNIPLARTPVIVEQMPFENDGAPILKATKSRSRPSSRSSLRALKIAAPESVPVSGTMVKDAGEESEPFRSSSERPSSSASARSWSRRSTPRQQYFQRIMAQYEDAAELPPRIPNDSTTTENLLLDKIQQRLGGPHVIARAFCYFDKQKLGLVCYEDFRAVVRDFGLGFDEDQIIDLFKRYDMKNKGFIEYADFKRVIDVYNQGMGSSSFEKRDPPQLKIKAKVTHITPGTNFKALLKQKIYERTGSHGQHSLLKSFKLLNTTHNTPDVTFEEFEKICRHFGMNMSLADLLEIFKQFDKDNKGTINYHSFITEVLRDNKVYYDGFPKLSGHDITFKRTRRSKQTKQEQTAEAITSIRSKLDDKSLHLLWKEFRARDILKHGLLTFPEFRRSFAVLGDTFETEAEQLRVIYEELSRDTRGAIRYKTFMKCVGNVPGDESFLTEKATKVKQMLSNKEFSTINANQDLNIKQ